jgi:hypothetical protein
VIFRLHEFDVNCSAEFLELSEESDLSQFRVFANSQPELPPFAFCHFSPGLVKVRRVIKIKKSDNFGKFEKN